MLYSMTSCGQPCLFPFPKGMKAAPPSREGDVNKAYMDIALLASKKNQDSIRSIEIILFLLSRKKLGEMSFGFTMHNHPENYFSLNF